MATEDIHRQRSLQSRRFALNARKLAEFLQSVESKETLLVQRARDREVRDTVAARGVQASSACSGPMTCWPFTTSMAS